MTEPLLRCLRWDEEGDARLRSMSGPDWEALLSRLSAGKGFAFLDRRMKMAGIAPPAPVAAALHQRMMALAIRNFGGRAALGTVIRDADRPALLLKGVDLAERLYGNPGHRPMGDIDFLIHDEDLLVFGAALSRQGYSSEYDISDPHLTASRGHHVLFRREGNALPFELHWHLQDDLGADDAFLAGIWSRAVPAPQIAPKAFVMAPEDLFLCLCLHLRHHIFETPLSQIWDIAEFLRADKLAADWTVIWERARQWRLTESVRVALYAANKSLGVATPQLGGWQPDPSLAVCVPDVVSNLGRYARMPTAPLVTMLARQSTLKNRLSALHAGLFQRHGNTARKNTWTGTLLGRPAAYVRRLQDIRREYGTLLWKWLRGDPETVAMINQRDTLRRYLEKE
jgi:hypothetical protein